MPGFVLRTLAISLCFGLLELSGSEMAQAAGVALKVEPLNTGLQNPWGLAFLPDGRMLVTERAGALLLLSSEGKTLKTLRGVPAVQSEGQGGLLDVVIDPAFAANRRIYLSFCGI
jgi:glucose/arabinose dehydrogenase